MELWPAIDIREGRVVRLRQGDFAVETRYGDPVSVAASLVDGGARRLHVVDLDGALAGHGVNRKDVAAVAARVGSSVKLQVGGGIRHAEDVEEVLGLGADRVVMGTTAVEETESVRALTSRWPGRVLAGLDYRFGDGGALRLAVRGWTESSGRPISEVLRELEDACVAGVVATDIGRDGTRTGPDLAGLASLLAATPLPVVASGGVSALDDLAALCLLASGGRQIAGVIVGKAILEGNMTVAEAESACCQAR